MIDGLKMPMDKNKTNKPGTCGDGINITKVHSRTDNLNTIIGSSNSPVVAGSGSISHISEAVCSVSNNIMGAGSNINGSPSSNITGSVAPTSTINNKISIGLGVTKN